MKYREVVDFMLAENKKGDLLVFYNRVFYDIASRESYTCFNEDLSNFVNECFNIEVVYEVLSLKTILELARNRTKTIKEANSEIGYIKEIWRRNDKKQELESLIEKLNSDLTTAKIKLQRIREI